LVTYLKGKNALRGYCDPALWPRLSSHFGTEFKVEHAFDRTRIDDYAFGITRAAGAIAESGTIILNDAVTSQRLAALAPWVHVAVIERASIFGDVQQAVAALGTDRNVIWCTGPSKTADVEGILIEGVHGPGIEIGLVL
jgi:L-lactate dehydrogenase complex protein LldG